MLARQRFQITDGTGVTCGQAAVDAGEKVAFRFGQGHVLFPERSLHFFGHAVRRQKTVVAGVHGIGIGRGRCHIRHLGKGIFVVQFMAHALQHPQAHDVAKQAHLAAVCALVGKAGHARGIAQMGIVGFNAQQTPCAAGKVHGAFVFGRHGHVGAAGIMGSGQDDAAIVAHCVLHALGQLSQHRAGQHGIFREQTARNLRKGEHMLVPFRLAGCEQRGGGGDGVFVGHHAGKEKVEIIRHEQAAVCFLQPFPRRSHQLIHGIEGLFGNAGEHIQRFVVDQVLGGIGAFVPVHDHGRYGRALFVHQYKVHAPGIHAHGGGNFAQVLTLFHAGEDMVFQFFPVPAKQTVFAYRAVFKAVHFFQHPFAVLNAAQNMPSGAGADIDGQRIGDCHKNVLLSGDGFCFIDLYCT